MHTQARHTKLQKKRRKIPPHKPLKNPTHEFIKEKDGNYELNDSE